MYYCAVRFSGGLIEKSRTLQNPLLLSDDSRTKLKNKNLRNLWITHDQAETCAKIKFYAKIISNRLRNWLF